MEEVGQMIDENLKDGYLDSVLEQVKLNMGKLAVDR